MNTHLYSDETFAFIIMAAGESKRLGQPKQLIKQQGETLLSHQISRCQQISEHVYCLLGFKANEIEQTIKQNNVNILINDNWHLGLGSSIASAIAQLPTSIEGAMIILVDQWALTESDLNRLLTTWQSDRSSIIVSKSALHNELSPPIIFPKQYFSALKKLSGEKGAKPVLQANKEQTIGVTLENAFYDLDTPEQLENLPK